MANRRTFTDLAEFIGQLAAGRIPLTEVIEELAATLEETGEPGFKRDKFTQHAETQRTHEALRVAEVKVGETYTIDGLLLRADSVNQYGHTVTIETYSDTAEDDPSNHVGRLKYRLDSDTMV